jgi:hypothetical protein
VHCQQRALQRRASPRAAAHLRLNILSDAACALGDTTCCWPAYARRICCCVMKMGSLGVRPIWRSDRNSSTSGGVYVRHCNTLFL